MKFTSQLQIGFLLAASIIVCNAIDRSELVDYLRYKQLTRSTLDGRIDQQVVPIGYLDGKPIWPRILEKVRSPQRIAYDDDSFAYQNGGYDAVDLVHKMDREDNYRRVIKFLERYTK